MQRRQELRLPIEGVISDLWILAPQAQHGDAECGDARDAGAEPARTLADSLGERSLLGVLGSPGCILRCF